MSSFLSSTNNSCFDGALGPANEKKKQITALFLISPVKLAAFVLMAMICFFFSLAGLARIFQ
jgi:hypothetical protein